MRTFLSDPGSESKIGRLGGWGWKKDPEDLLSRNLALCFPDSVPLVLVISQSLPPVSLGKIGAALRIN